MANVFTDVIPIIFARALQTLRATCALTQVINRDFENTPANTGDTVNVWIPSAAVDSDVAPTAAPQAGQDTVPKRVPVTLNRWRHSGFYLDDKNAESIAAGVYNAQIPEHIKALAQGVNSYVFSLYTGFYGLVGTPGVTPFATDTTAATQARKLLNKQLAPMDPRYIILNPDAEASALEQVKLSGFQNTGSQSAIIQGQIGQRYGMTWLMDQQVPTHPSVAMTAGAATANGVQAINAGSIDGGRTGTLSIAKATNATNLIVGDILTIAGQTQQYVVTAAVTLAVGNTTVNIAPALQVATAGGEAITLAAAHVVNLAIHRDAIAFASRPLQKTSQNTVEMMSIPDPVTGLNLRLELVRQNKQWFYDFDILYGASVARAELGVRIAG